MKTLLDYITEAKHENLSPMSDKYHDKDTFAKPMKNNRIEFNDKKRDTQSLDFLKLEQEIGKVSGEVELFFKGYLNNLTNLDQAQNHYKINALRIDFDNWTKISSGIIKDQTFIGRDDDFNPIYLWCLGEYNFKNCTFESLYTVVHAPRGHYKNKLSLDDIQGVDDWYLKLRKKHEYDDWIDHLLNDNNFNCEWVELMLDDYFAYSTIFNEPNIPLDIIFPECKKLLKKGVSIVFEVIKNANKSKIFVVTNTSALPDYWKKNGYKIVNTSAEGYDIWSIRVSWEK